ncbi:hypothetical protein HVA01_33450 [Halovibrio variabilis]|uniref:Uncharacterized protein n=1 Tax=Halovibrio variabilis TaxID=31910 RepID=A0A511USY4_9GAMM|nr:hypothetical protein HVA01_33450 [Halovibrio variabilis]
MFELIQVDLSPKPLQMAPQPSGDDLADTLFVRIDLNNCRNLIHSFLQPSSKQTAETYCISAS